MLVAAGEAHLLNLSIAAAWQRRGHGSALLAEAMRLARGRGAASMFLEVRPSNRPGQALYERIGFRKLALRRGYYPAHERPRGRAGAELGRCERGGTRSWRRWGWRRSGG